MQRSELVLVCWGALPLLLGVGALAVSGQVALAPEADAPANAQSGNAQSSDRQSSDRQSSDRQSSDRQPSDRQPSDRQPSDVQPSDVQPSDVQPSDVQPSDGQSSDRQSSDRQLSDSTSSDSHTEAQTQNRPSSSPGAEPPLDGRDGRPLAIEQFRPKSQLRLPNHQPPRAKFPVVDVHVHPRLRFRHVPERLDEFVRVMDDQNIALCVSLDGQLGDALQEHKKYLWEKHADRFLIFANIDWQGSGSADDPASWDCHRPDFGRRVAEQLADAKRRGAVGLKIFKRLGLAYKNPDGTLIAVDDPRWDPIWEACGRLGMPVLIHTADPVAFFEPVDQYNERWEELRRHPDWSFHGPQFPSHDELLAARNRVIARHPETTFIGAHVANFPENLAVVGQWLDAYPNLMIDMTSRIAELGRQPYTAREFFMKYADRIMFGSDGPRPAARLLPHWRFFETCDEYFAYAENAFPPQGFWNIYGLGLPDDVLKKLYHENAARIIPGVRKKLDAYLRRSASGE